MVGRPRKTVIAAVYPLASGAAHFNAALVRAMAQRSATELISWRRMYPPLLYRGQRLDDSEAASPGPAPTFLLEWQDPRTWRKALARVAEFEAHALVLPWLHPVLAPPYRYLLKHAPAETTRVVICHNVLPHEPFPGAKAMTRAVLRHADLLVTHAPHQRSELAALGLTDSRVLEAFHPRFVAADLAPNVRDDEIAEERARLGVPDLLLLAFGAVRRYKGIDVALDALKLVDPGLDVKLVVAGRFWSCGDELRAQAERLGLSRRVVFREGYVPNRDAAVLFRAADALVLPYRSASQSGVAQLSFAFGRPVIATRVGGLPAAVRHGRDGLLCDPEDPVGLARAIEDLARTSETLGAGVRVGDEACSFAHYSDLLDSALVGAAA
jgi:glycosyltransferase involved in cell wall biosynthesis